MSGHGLVTSGLHALRFGFNHIFSDGSNDYLVVVYSCSGAQWQDWQRKGDTVYNAGHGKCVTIVGSEAKGRACDGSDIQKWDMP